MGQNQEGSPIGSPKQDLEVNLDPNLELVDHGLVLNRNETKIRIKAVGAIKTERIKTKIEKRTERKTERKTERMIEKKIEKKIERKIELKIKKRTEKKIENQRKRLKKNFWSLFQKRLKMMMILLKKRFPKLRLRR